MSRDPQATRRARPAPAVAVPSEPRSRRADARPARR